MNPGRELDTLVAEKVMGLKVVKETWANGTRVSYSIGKPEYYDIQGDMQLANPLPNYSEDIAAAWEVIDKMIMNDWEVFDAGYARCTKKWNFDFNNGVLYEGPRVNTAPHAICLAALKAVSAGRHLEEL